MSPLPGFSKERVYLLLFDLTAVYREPIVCKVAVLRSFPFKRYLSNTYYVQSRCVTNFSIQEVFIEYLRSRELCCDLILIVFAEHLLSSFCFLFFFSFFLEGCPVYFQGKQTRVSE